MRIRKFVSPTFQEAMEQVKKELGPDAIVLSTRTLGKDVFGMKKGAVEVTVAVEEDDDTPVGAQQKEDLVPEMREILRELKSLRSEIGFLKETLKPIVPVLTVSERKKQLFTELLKRGVEVNVAFSIVKRCGDGNAGLREVIEEDVKVEPPLAGKEKGMIFLGPPGVGKTTSLSKIAHVLREKDKKVSIVTLDTDRVGQVAFVKELAGRLGCRLELVRDVDSLPGVVYREMESGFVLVDTPGTIDEKVCEGIRDFFPAPFPLKKCFLIDASVTPSSASKLWERNPLKDTIEAVGFTKLDLTASFGNIINVIKVTGKPVSFISTGTRIPEDIKIPTTEFIASLIAGGER